MTSKKSRQIEFTLARRGTRLTLKSPTWSNLITKVNFEICRFTELIHSKFFGSFMKNHEKIKFWGCDFLDQISYQNSVGFRLQPSKKINELADISPNLFDNFLIKSYENFNLTWDRIPCFIRSDKKNFDFTNGFATSFKDIRKNSKINQNFFLKYVG